MRKHRLLFLIILLEGYVVLACELLAIRLLMPFTGSGVETVSIIISAVLLPLAVGYHAGGQAYARSAARARKKGKAAPSVRQILLKNLVAALLLLALGLSYPCIEMFFGALRGFGVTHRLPQTALYSLLFLVVPVYKLGQTVPLVSSYFPRGRLSAITGRMLFCSTVGSFLGSVFSTIVLMSFIGVHYTAVFTLALLVGLIALLARLPRYGFELVLAVTFLGIAAWFNNGAMLMQQGIVQNNHYSMVSVATSRDGRERDMQINRSASSRVTEDPARRYRYIAYLEDTFIAPLARIGGNPRDILVIGAGGFTLGHKDGVNRYTYVDIDPALKNTAETYFLREKLGSNKRFVAESARAFLRRAEGTYDLIVIDVYSNEMAIPMETVTREFLQGVKNLLKPGGAVAANIIESPDFSDRFTLRYDNTFRSVFPHYTRQVVVPFHPWGGARNLNVLYLYYDREGMDDAEIYIDDKNSYSLDR